jgi:hypothetical protein
MHWFGVDSSTSRLTAHRAADNGTAVAFGRSTGGGNSEDLAAAPVPASTHASASTGPRTADGAIPTSDFLHPANRGVPI